MRQSRRLLFCAAALAFAAGGVAGRVHGGDNRQSAVAVSVDWPSFLARQDPIWETLPARFDHGAFLGNGLMGATIYRDGNTLPLEMGRADVTEHRRDNARLPIGGLVLTTAGKIQGGTLRLDLWNAEVRGESGPTREPSASAVSSTPTRWRLFTDIETRATRQRAKFAWEARPAIDRAEQLSGARPGRPRRTRDRRRHSRSAIQPRFGRGWRFATAWREMHDDGARAARASGVSASPTRFPGNTAAAEAVATVKNVAPPTLPPCWMPTAPGGTRSIPRVSSPSPIPRPRASTGSSSTSWPAPRAGPRAGGSARALVPFDRLAAHLVEPQYRDPLSAGLHREPSGAGRIVRQLPRQEAGQLLPQRQGDLEVRRLRHGPAHHRLRGPARRRHAGPRSVTSTRAISPGPCTTTTCTTATRWTSASSPTRRQHAFYPLLRGSVNLYLKLLKKGGDGKLHLPVLHSPEYGNDADNNYNLALLRWGVPDADRSEPALPAQRSAGPRAGRRRSTILSPLRSTTTACGSARTYRSPDRTGTGRTCS